MQDFVYETAQALQLVTSGALVASGAVALGSAQEAGAELYRKAISMLSKLAMDASETSLEIISNSVQEAVDSGLVTTADMVHLVRQHATCLNQSFVHNGDVKAKTVFSGYNSIGIFKG